MFDSVVIKLGHDACLRDCLDAVVLGERSRAIMALLFLFRYTNIGIPPTLTKLPTRPYRLLIKNVRMKKFIPW
jgi:hypothetical protein